MIARYGGGGLIEDVFVPEYCMEKGTCAAYGDLVQQSNNRLLRLTDKGYKNASASVRQALAEASLPTVRHYSQRARLSVNRARMAGKAMGSAEAEDVFGDGNLAARQRQQLSGRGDGAPPPTLEQTPSPVREAEQDVARLEAQLARAKAKLAGARAAELSRK
jgi:hypothetical protein